MPMTAAVRIRAENDAAGSPPFVLVHNPDRIPLAANDGTAIDMCQLDAEGRPTSVNVTATEFGVEYRNGNYYGEAAFGYFKEIAPRLVFETYAGVGAGITSAVSQNLATNTQTTVGYQKIYLQQDIGLNFKNLKFGLAVREAYVNASKTKIDGVDQNIQQMDVFIEPILFLAIGFEKFKINAQAGISDSQFDWITSYAPFIFSIGVEYGFIYK